MSKKMKAIRVASDIQFERLLNHMAHESSRAADHWHLLKGLETARMRFAAEMYESRAFWNFTLNAHYDAVVFRLARLYDQHDSGLSLKRFLLTLKENATYLSDDARRKRLKDNPFVETLISRKLNRSTLGSDIRRVSEETDPLVKRLRKVRDEVLSHVQPNPVLGLVPSPRLKDRDVHTLLNRARGILNRYSLLFRASVSSSTVVGADDYLSLLSRVQQGRKLDIERDEDAVRRYLATRASMPTPNPSSNS